MGEAEVISQDLGRVFLNMVSNACYATDERRRANAEAGAGAERYSPTVWLKTRRGEETAEIRIRDNGTGMPPDVVEKMFNPFFTTKPTDQGTGLGLAISNDIIRRHGGSITVESEPGQFTEMTIELPLVAPTIPVEDVNGASDHGNDPGHPHCRDWVVKCIQLYAHLPNNPTSNRWQQEHRPVPAIAFSSMV